MEVGVVAEDGVKTIESDRGVPGEKADEEAAESGVDLGRGDDVVERCDEVGGTGRLLCIPTYEHVFPAVLHLTQDGLVSSHLTFLCLHSLHPSRDFLCFRMLGSS